MARRRIRMLLRMPIMRKVTLFDLLKASLVWLAFGFSLGWYHSFTYYGRVGWPMPLPEACVSLILYYFPHRFVFRSPNIWFQTFHWLAMFPVAGILWVSTLAVTSPFFGGRRVEYGWTVVRFSLTTLPVIALGPVMAYFAGHSAYGGFSWHAMVDTALRRGTIPTATWYTPAYLTMSLMALAWQLRLYKKIFDTKGRKAWLHFLTSAILLSLLACGAGVALSFPFGLALR